MWAWSSVMLCFEPLSLTICSRLQRFISLQFSLAEFSAQVAHFLHSWASTGGFTASRAVPAVLSSACDASLRDLPVKSAGTQSNTAWQEPTWWPMGTKPAFLLISFRRKAWQTVSMLPSCRHRCCASCQRFYPVRSCVLEDGRNLQFWCQQVEGLYHTVNYGNHHVFANNWDHDMRSDMVLVLTQIVLIFWTCVGRCLLGPNLCLGDTW